MKLRHKHVERPNHPAPGNAGITLFLRIEHHYSGVPEPERWAPMNRLLFITLAVMLSGCAAPSNVERRSNLNYEECEKEQAELVAVFTLKHREAPLQDPQEWYFRRIPKKLKGAISTPIPQHMLTTWDGVTAEGNGFGGSLSIMHVMNDNVLNVEVESWPDRITISAPTKVDNFGRTNKIEYSLTWTWAK